MKETADVDGRELIISALGLAHSFTSCAATHILELVYQETSLGTGSGSLSLPKSLKTTRALVKQLYADSLREVSRFALEQTSEVPHVPNLLLAMAGVTSILTDFTVVERICFGVEVPQLCIGAAKELAMLAVVLTRGVFIGPAIDQVVLASLGSELTILSEHDLLGDSGQSASLQSLRTRLRQDPRSLLNSADQSLEVAYQIANSKMPILRAFQRTMMRTML